MTGLSVLALGFVLGLRHACDADHVVAVSTIVARTKRLGAAWLLGAFWGAGHSLTILLVGAAMILFKVVIPPRVGLSMEFAVGVVLVGLGALNLSGTRLWRVHRHEHGHAEGGHRHAHVHFLRPAWLRETLETAGAGRLSRSLAVGLVHGLAGSAAIALLVLATIPRPGLGLAYLGVFGLGTLVGMLSLSAAMEVPMLAAARGWSEGGRALAAASGALSLCFGLYVAYRVGFVDGLFSAVPRWTPQ